MDKHHLYKTGVSNAKIIASRLFSACTCFYLIASLLVVLSFFGFGNSPDGTESSLMPMAIVMWTIPSLASRGLILTMIKGSKAWTSKLTKGAIIFWYITFICSIFSFVSFIKFFNVFVYLIIGFPFIALTVLLSYRSDTKRFDVNNQE